MKNTVEDTIIAYNLYRIDATDEVKDKFLCNYLDKNKKNMDHITNILSM